MICIMPIIYKSPNLLTKQEFSNQSVNITQINQKFNYRNDTISFGQSPKIPQKALNSLEQMKKKFGDQLILENKNELDGLQNGIEIFKDLSFSQIAYVLQNLKMVMLQRGCNNACLHCLIEAQTPYHMKANNYLDKMAFEDFENLCNGFKEINKRLGFNAMYNPNTYNGLFYDADCSKISIQDKKGTEYDYADLAKMFHQTTGNVIIFDTAGWNINDTKTQKRMDALVQKVVNSDDYNFLQFNISINPFHSIYNKSIELKEQGKKEEAKKLYDIHINRMANVIYTFSPLMEKTNSVTSKNMLNFLLRGLFDFTDLYGYRAYDTKILFKDIIEKVNKMYTEDFESGRHKVINSKKQKDDYYYFLLAKSEKRIELINLCNEKLINKLGDISAGEWYVVRENSFNSALEGSRFDSGFIDANGKFYMTNYIETYPTDIVLNFQNKDKPTAPIKPNLRDEVITKDIIEK